MLWMFLACSGKPIDSAAANPQCTPEEFPADSFLLLPAETRTQIHSDTASNGLLTWVVYNLPNDSNQFETHLLALGCDGQLAWGPELIMVEPGVNQTTPRVAVSGDRVLVATGGDSGQGPTNLSLRIYIQDSEGEVIADRIWAPPIEETTEGNRWLPSVVGTEEGFWMAAAVGRDTHFQTAVQALDREGEPRGDAHWVGPDAYAVFPNIDADGDRYVVAWETGEESVGWQQGGVDGADAESLIQSNAGAPRVLWADGQPRLLSHQRSPLQVQADGQPISESSSTHFPNAAQGDSTTLFTHYRLLSGTQNALLYGQLGAAGALRMDQELTSDPPAAPYRPAVTHVSGDSYLVLWSEGINPNFVLRGQFITLQP